ncbi:PAS domain S-box protein [Natronoarchaeum sp. GCM10025321]|uniref:PAS domain S-box protein n=1 Tax=Natronoarchaeum sp. GCM10025321 TaxID=3252684 RepID=UPI00361AB288
MSDKTTAMVVGRPEAVRDRIEHALETSALAVVTDDGSNLRSLLASTRIDCIVSTADTDSGNWQPPFEASCPRPFVLCAPDDDIDLAAALNAGVDGYVSPEEIDTELVERVRAAVDAAPELGTGERKRELERRDLIVETVGDGVYSLDTDGCYTMLNEAIASMTGYSREELLGSHVSRLMSDEDIERGRKLIQQMLDEDGPDVQSYEVELIQSDGERIPCEVIMSLLPGEKRFNGTVGSVRDISEQKRMEEELRERKRNVESVHRAATQLENTRTAETIDDIALDAVLDVLEVDVCCLQTTDDSETRWHAPAATIDGEEYPADALDEQIHERTVRGDKTFIVDDLHERRRPAQQTAIRSLLSVPVGDSGVFQAGTTTPDAFKYDDAEIAELLFAHVANAVERIDVEARLVDERDRFAALFENVPDPVVSVRYEGDVPIVLKANPAFERTFGYDIDQLRGESLDAFVVPPESVERAAELNERGRQGQLVETEVERQTASGRRKFRLTVVPVDLGEDSPITYGVYTDITDQKRQRQRVEVLNRVLRHDLRNGMNIVKGCAEMLESADGDGHEYAKTIQRRADELISLAEKTRAVEQTLERDEGQLGSVDVVETVQTTAGSIEGKHDSVELSLSIPDSAHARADDMLRTAIRHVLDNAIVHNEGVASVSVDVSTDDQYVTVTIEDDGPGIPRAEWELLDDDREITQLRHASGLGLWLVNWVVTQSGGTLSFETDGVDGTRVIIAVPRALADEELEAQ